MKTLALSIAAALTLGLLCLAIGAARIHPAPVWAGLALIGAGFFGLYFT